MENKDCKDWYNGWLGEEKYLPRSHGQGIRLAQSELFPLLSELARYTGVPYPGVSDLHALIQRISSGKSFTCQVCNDEILIFPGTLAMHSLTCPLMEKAETILHDRNGLERGRAEKERLRLLEKEQKKCRKKPINQ